MGDGHTSTDTRRNGSDQAHLRAEAQLPAGFTPPDPNCSGDSTRPLAPTHPPVPEDDSIHFAGSTAGAVALGTGAPTVGYVMPVAGRA